MTTQPAPMPFSHMMLLGGRLCLDFCNTVEYHDSENSIDFLRQGYAAFVYWCKRAAVLDSAQVERLIEQGSQQPDSTEAIFERVLRLREALYQLFAAIAHSKPLPAEHLDILNTELAHAYSLRALVVDVEHKLTWGWQEVDSAELPLLPIIISAGELLTSNELDRLRQCPGCGWMFLDQSKNRSRTWCNMRICGNRAKARQFYQRKKADKQTG